MPKTKNQAKNKSRFEVRGGVINEFEFALNEGAMTEEEHQRFTRQEDERRAGEDAPAAAPQTEAERIQQLMADVHEKVARKQHKQAGANAASKPRAGSTARAGKAGKSSAKKARAGGKSVGTKGAAAGAKKGVAKKGVAKKAGAKSGTKKSGAKKQSARKGAARKSVRAR